MKAQTLIIEKKRYAVISENEYLSLKEDIADLKMIAKRRNETSVEAKDFFVKLKKAKK
jgi:hypothetical protein